MTAMHELSIVQNIIDIAERKVAEVNAGQVESIDLEIGTLSCVDMIAFKFAWKHATNNTVLEAAHCNFKVIPGHAECGVCTATFHVDTLYQECPNCGSYSSSILEGQELILKSLVVH